MGSRIGKMGSEKNGTAWVRIDYAVGKRESVFVLVLHTFLRRKLQRAW